jgi:hypothetical protein
MPVGTMLRRYRRRPERRVHDARNRDSTRTQWAARYFCVVIIFALNGWVCSAINDKFSAPVAEARLAREERLRQKAHPANQPAIEPLAAGAATSVSNTTNPQTAPSTNQANPTKAPSVEAGDSALAAKPPVPSAWALVSRDNEGQRLAEWVPVDAQKVHAQDWAKNFYEEIQEHDPWIQHAAKCMCFGFPFLLTLIFVASTVLTGLLSRPMLDEDREWLARASGWAFLLALLSCGLNCIVVYGPETLAWFWQQSPKLVSSVVGGSGLITILGGQSEKTAASGKEDKKPGSKDWILQLLVKCAAPIFIVFLLMLLSTFTVLLLQKLPGLEVGAFPGDVREHVRFVTLSLLAAGFLGLAFFFSIFVNINKFSLHAMYRNRLLRAYLGATHTDRVPNSFTGFDENDNLDMKQLRAQRPLHVLNTALNLVHGSELAWQQRLATSFTFTPFTAGSAMLGYRDTKEYAMGANNDPITLGTAMAISGAAVSPNQGYNSSPVIAVLLTFFNARLGGWFGNPGLAGGSSWRRAAPGLALWPLICEALGLTDARHPYVYLSDGGHFENLGIYEMIMRRCRFIVVSDASCDPAYTFEDLGNAISKIRVDFGIPIIFKPNIEIKKYKHESGGLQKKPARHCAIARIRYSQVDCPPSASAGDKEKRDGWLIYIKPAMCGSEPMDVYHYQKAHPAFPHEPTTDQWFTESQFESYRMLGLHTIERICAGGSVTGLESFCNQVAKYLAGEHDEDEECGPIDRMHSFIDYVKDRVVGSRGDHE